MDLGFRVIENLVDINIEQDRHLGIPALVTIIQGSFMISSRSSGSIIFEFVKAIFKLFYICHIFWRSFYQVEYIKLPCHQHKPEARAFSVSALFPAFFLC